MENTTTLRPLYAFPIAATPIRTETLDGEGPGRSENLGCFLVGVSLLALVGGGVIHLGREIGWSLADFHVAFRTPPSAESPAPRTATSDRSTEPTWQGKSALVWHERVKVLWQQAESEAARGQDPSGSYLHAIDACNATLALDGGLAMAYSNRGDIWECLAEWRASHGMDPSQFRRAALEDFDVALTRDPRFWQAWANKGLALENAGRFQEAVASYDRALAIVGGGYPRLGEWRARAEAAGHGQRP